MSLGLDPTGSLIDCDTLVLTNIDDGLVKVKDGAIAAATIGEQLNYTGSTLKVLIQQNLDMHNYKIINLAPGENETDAVNVSQLDGELGFYLPLAGGTMSGDIVSESIWPIDGTRTIGRALDRYLAMYANNVNTVDLLATGAVTTSQVEVDNLLLTDSTISTIGVDSNLLISPNGTGMVLLTSNIGPQTTDTKQLGTPGNRWGNAYIKDILADNILLAGNCDALAMTAGYLVLSDDTISSVHTGVDMEISPLGANLRVNSDLYAYDIVPQANATYTLGTSGTRFSTAYINDTQGTTGTWTGFVNCGGLTSDWLTLSGDTLSSSHVNTNISITPSGTGRLQVNSAINSQHVLPQLNATYDLGATGTRYANGYVNVMNSSNTNSTNVAATSVVSTQIAGGNLDLSTNILSSTNTNGNIAISPNGTGIIQTNASVSSRTILPQATLTYDLGSNALKYNNVYTYALASTVCNATDFAGTTSTIGRVTISGDTIANTTVNNNLVLAPSGTGRVRLNAAPVNTLDAATKGYVDTAAGAYLPLAGGTLTGTLNCRAVTPTANLTYDLGSGAAAFNRGYINELFALSSNATYTNATDFTGTTSTIGNLYTSSDTIANTVTNNNIILAPSGTGRVRLNAAPINSLDAATKGYVDGLIVGSYLPTIGSSTANALTRWSGTAGSAVKNSTWVVDDTGQLTVSNGSRTVLASTNSAVSTDLTIRCTMGSGATATQIFTDGTNTAFHRWWGQFQYFESTSPGEYYLNGFNILMRASNGQVKMFDNSSGSGGLFIGGNASTAMSIQLNGTNASTQSLQFLSAGSASMSISAVQNATAANRVLNLNNSSGTIVCNTTAVNPNSTNTTDLGTSSLKYKNFYTTSLISTPSNITWADANVTRNLASQRIVQLITAGNYNCTNNSGVNLDTGSGVITFTVPASGKVGLRIEGGILAAASAATLFTFGLSTTSAAQASTLWDFGYLYRIYIQGSSEVYTPYGYREYRGLTPGTSYTLYLKYIVHASGQSVIVTSGSSSATANTFSPLALSVEYLQ